MRKTYKILLVIFFILILKCITPEDVQADTFHLLDTSYNEIEEISLKTKEEKTIVIGIISDRDNAKISEVTLPSCIDDWEQEGGSGNVWHVATDKGRTNNHDLIMEIHIKGGDTEGDNVTTSGTVTIDVQTLKTELKWRPDIGIASFEPYESVYATSSLNLKVHVTDPFKQSQLDEVNNLEKYMEELVNELEKGPDSIPALISAAGSDNYKLALLFAALANFEDLHNEMINCARR